MIFNVNITIAPLISVKLRDPNTIGQVDNNLILNKTVQQLTTQSYTEIWTTMKNLKCDENVTPKGNT